ncbi:MAG TPA: hypothetical protein VGD10_08215 [Allosphingosinicella sp.]|uniref:hypothetical protein n=1 Tax=Allosphingosinicella sp. TaxID=2823234 RepID=UPI002EDB71D7
MTKRRSPLTFENALAQVASKIGWDGAAKIIGRADRTIRNWSDPDTSAGITLDKALELDLAYAAQGGEGYPLFQCFSTRLEVDAANLFASKEAIVRSLASAVKENGEAVSAALSATLPGATEADFIVAERELEESIAADTHALATIRAGRTGAAPARGGAST